MGERAGLNGGVRTAWVQGKGREERKGWERSVGAREWLEMGGEKKPLEISELGCADGCGREMGAENCADGCRRRGCNGVAGNGWGEEAAGDERAWLRGRLRTSGWKWGRRSRWRSASLAARTAADGKWVGRIARTAADGVGARELLEMGGEKKPLRDQRAWLRCGQEMGAENCADGCGRRGCNGVAGNGWGEEAAGDERAWLRGRLRTGNGCGELRGRLGTQGATEWLEMGGERR